MFKKEKRNTNIETNIDGYLKFIDRVLKDEEIKKEIKGEIKRFKNEGIITIDGNNLTGKILGRLNNLYLDIKYDKDKFVCSYTNWSINSPVLIEQDVLKEGNYKTTKTEKAMIFSSNNINAYETKILEKVHNRDGILLYESESNEQEEFSSFNDKLIYRDDSPFKNYFNIEKTWYIPNGSVIKYTMSKNELHTKEGIQESYSICEGPIKTEQGSFYYFDKLPKELFISFMTGRTTIQEVLNEVKKKGKAKTLKNH